MMNQRVSEGKTSNWGFPGFLIYVVFSFSNALLAGSTAVYLPNDPVFSQYAPNEPHQQGLFMLNMPQAWAIERGNKDVVIAVIDWAFDIRHPHPEIKNKVWVNIDEIPDNGIDDDKNGYIDDIHGWDFAENDNTLYGSGAGHGNHVAGIIAAETNNNIGIAGMAPNCPLMLIKAGTPGVVGDAKTFALTIRYAVDNGAKIICKNHFLWEKPPGYSTPMGSELKQACDYAYKKGVLITSVSGENDTVFRSAVFQTAYDSVMGTGPSDIFEGIPADFAGGSPFIEAIAPGGERGTTMTSKHNDRSVYSCSTSDKYLYYTGGCMANPHVTGLLALVLSHYLGIDVEKARQIVRNTAKIRRDTGLPEYLWGHGIIDPVAALSLSSKQLAAIPVLIKPKATLTTNKSGKKAYRVRLKNEGAFDAAVKISISNGSRRLATDTASVRGFEHATVLVPAPHTTDNPNTASVTIKNLGIRRPRILDDNVDIQLHISNDDVSVTEEELSNWHIVVNVHNNGSDDAERVAVILYQGEPTPPNESKSYSLPLDCAIIRVPAKRQAMAIFQADSIPGTRLRGDKWYHQIYKDWFKTHMWVQIENLEIGAQHIDKSAAKARMVMSIQNRAS